MVKKKTWGGQWTEEKLDAFEKYVKAYLIIMNKYRDARKWQLLYFDGFAGSGSRSQVEEAEEVEHTIDLFGQDITADDFKVYQGAAERVVKVENDNFKGFDHYFFVEKSEESCRALESKLEKYDVTGKKHFLKKDANDAVSMLANSLKKRRDCKALAFLDPFGMQIDWASIASLKDLSVDLWILVPTGVIVNRLLERNVNQQIGLRHAEKLESFFGIPESKIRDVFYREEQIETLFGEQELMISKAENAIKKIAKLYVDRLGEIFPHVTNEPMVLYNNHNVPIYHLVFAAKNQIAMKIAQDIIKKR